MCFKVKASAKTEWAERLSEKCQSAEYASPIYIMWTTLEPEDRNQKYASVPRQPTASITSVIIVIIIITTIILLINLKVV